MKTKISKQHMENLRKTISAVRAAAREICLSEYAGQLETISIGVGAPDGIEVVATEQFGEDAVECGLVGEALAILNWEIWKYFPNPANENEYHERWFREVEALKDEDEDDYYATLLTIRFTARGRRFKVEWNPKLRKIRRGKNQPYCLSPLSTPAEEIVRNIAIGTGWSMAVAKREIHLRIGLDTPTFEMWMLGWREPAETETFQRRLYFAQFARETMVKIPKAEEKLIAAARYVGLNVIVTE